MTKEKIGPFRPFDVSAVEDILRRLGIAYEIFVDEEERDRKITQHNENASNSPRTHAGQFDASYVYVVVDDAALTVIGDRLEKFGVVRQSDGRELDVHEFVCTRCKYRDYDMPRCSKCGAHAVDVDTDEGQKVFHGEVGAWTKEKIIIAIAFALMFLYGMMKFVK